MTHEVTDRHPAQALRRCATTPKKSLSTPRERGDVRSADAILHSNPIRRSAAMMHGDSGRHTAHALRRCATTPKESLSAPRERGDVRSADTLSVNPGLRPGQSDQRSMHRNAVPLRHKLVFAFWIKPAVPRKNRSKLDFAFLIKPAAPRKNRSKLHFSLGLRGFSLGLH